MPHQNTHTAHDAVGGKSSTPRTPRGGHGHRGAVNGAVAQVTRVLHAIAVGVSARTGGVAGVTIVAKAVTICEMKHNKSTLCANNTVTARPVSLRARPHTPRPTTYRGKTKTKQDEGAPGKDGWGT